MATISPREPSQNHAEVLLKLMMSGCSNSLVISSLERTENLCTIRFKNVLWLLVTMSHSAGGKFAIWFRARLKPSSCWLCISPLGTSIHCLRAKTPWWTLPKQQYHTSNCLLPKDDVETHCIHGGPCLTWKCTSECFAPLSSLLECESRRRMRPIASSISCKTASALVWSRCFAQAVSTALSMV